MMPVCFRHALNVLFLQKNVAKVETAEERAARLEKEATFAQEAAKLRQEAARARILERHLREQVRRFLSELTVESNSMGSSGGCHVKKPLQEPLLCPRNWCA